MFGRGNNIMPFLIFLQRLQKSICEAGGLAYPTETQWSAFCICDDRNNACTRMLGLQTAPR
jgi:hypothetical protein